MTSVVRSIQGGCLLFSTSLVLLECLLQRKRFFARGPVVSQLILANVSSSE